jgi:hypothetical protein
MYYWWNTDVLLEYSCITEVQMYYLSVYVEFMFLRHTCLVGVHMN